MAHEVQALRRWRSQSRDGDVLLSMPWEVFVLGVALLSIANLVLAVVVRDPDLHQVIAVTDSQAGMIDASSDPGRNGAWNAAG